MGNAKPRDLPDRLTAAHASVASTLAGRALYHHGVPRTRLAGPRPRKALGQHFLRDSGVLLDIVSALPSPAGAVVVEIGAGTGQLTEALLTAGHTVVAVELEPRLVAHLSRRFAGQPRLRIVEADARTLDPDDVVPPRAPFLAVGNLPTSRRTRSSATSLRLRGSPGQPSSWFSEKSRERSPRSRARRRSWASQSPSTRPRNCSSTSRRRRSNPPPAVHSSVVRLEVRDRPLVPEERIAAFFTLVAKTFRNPRKQIHNALARETGLTTDQADAALLDAGVDPMRRAETLSVQDWLALLDAWERIRVVGG